MSTFVVPHVGKCLNPYVFSCIYAKFTVWFGVAEPWQTCPPQSPASYPQKPDFGRGEKIFSLCYVQFMKTWFYAVTIRTKKTEVLVLTFRLIWLISNVLIIINKEFSFAFRFGLNLPRINFTIKNGTMRIHYFLCEVVERCEKLLRKKF